ncbi:MAG: hypothetical protein AAFY37_05230 [Pseudomonadota bacterium]
MNTDPRADSIRWPQPGELWSLWDMLRLLRTSFLTEAGRAIGEAEEAYVAKEFRTEDEYGDITLNEEGWKKVQEALEAMASVASLFEEAALTDQLKDYAQKTEPMAQASFYVAYDFYRRSLSNTRVLVLAAGMERHLNQEQYFGAEVDEAFPSAAVEIRECGNCFALGRSTSAVYHALRALEVPLTRMGHVFGLLEFKNWNTALNEIEMLVRDRDNKDKVPNWERDKDFYTDAINHLFAIKNAWRNYTMHLRSRFNSEEAEEIIMATRAFMRKAAKVVAE